MHDRRLSVARRLDATREDVSGLCKQQAWGNLKSEGGGIIW